MTEVLKIEGLEKVERKMRHLADGPMVDKTLKTFAVLVEEDVRPYPPESSANRPPTPYYKRGLGTVTKSGSRKTSENMGKKWRIKENSKLIALQNTASYSGFVQGARQAKFHAIRGWKKVDKRAQELLPKLDAIFDRILKAEWHNG